MLHWMRCGVARWLFLFSAVGLFQLPANAAQYTFDLSTSYLSGPDGVGIYWRRIGDGPIEGPLIFGLGVGWEGNRASRSALDFNISRISDLEKVVSASLQLYPTQIVIQGLVNSVGSIRHLDASIPPVHPTSPYLPSDPERFTWDRIGAAPTVGNIGRGGAFGVYNSFDVTANTALDHSAGYNTSPFGLAENPTLAGGRSWVNYTQARLVIQTATPQPVRYQVVDLGSGHYRASYTITNEVSRPLNLLDISFDPALYREDSIVVSLKGSAASGWSGTKLSSGIGVPAAVTFASLSGSGLKGGESASGFDVEFDWLGTGDPMSQTFTVYDGTTFEALYSGTTIAAAVPELPTSVLAGAGLMLLAVGRRRIRRRERTRPVAWFTRLEAPFAAHSRAAA